MAKFDSKQAERMLEQWEAEAKARGKPLGSVVPAKYRKRAEQLLNQVGAEAEARGLLIRRPGTEDLAAVFDWPWHPFRQATREEGRELEGRKLFRLMRALGKEIPEDPERSLNPCLAEGHIEAIKKIGGLEAFALPFKRRFPEWDFISPQWSVVELILLSAYQVDPRTLKDMTLVDVRRYLLAEPKVSQPQKPVKSRCRTRRRPQKRKPTPRQLTLLALEAQRMSVGDIAKHLGITESGVRKHLKAAKRNVGNITGLSGQSVAAVTNTERLGERGKRHSYPSNPLEDDE